MRVLGGIRKTPALWNMQMALYNSTGSGYCYGPQIKVVHMSQFPILTRPFFVLSRLFVIYISFEFCPSQNVSGYIYIDMHACCNLFVNQ